MVNRITICAMLQVQLSSSLAQSEIEGQDAEASGPLGIPMVDELLGDSFLRHLFKQFFEVVAEADTSVSSAMQVQNTFLQANRLSSFLYVVCARDGSC